MTAVASAPTVAAERAQVRAEALTWCGTPFHHRARVKGAGVDCAQLLLGVYCGLGLVQEPVVEPYARDWFCHQDRERVLEVIRGACLPVEVPAVGDIALFKYGRCVSHAAIVTAAVPRLTVVHSFRAIGVIEEGCDPHSTLGSRLAGFWTLGRWAYAEHPEGAI